ncbi:MAG: NADH-quinone oxidoreductase subunit C [Promethearchaeota archaeon]
MGRMDEIRGQLIALVNDDYKDEKTDKYSRVFVRSKSQHIRSIARLLVEKLDGRLVAISANDEGLHGFDLVYHFDFSHQEKGLHLAMKVRLPRKKPIIDSITEIAWSANWAERELMDLLGIIFEGHPDPRKLFLPYAWPSEEVG